MTNIDLVEQLFATTTQLKKLISQKSYTSHEEKTATMLQFSALNFLKEQEQVTVGDLAESLQLSKSSATQLIERLVKMGLVKRISDKTDRRVTKIIVTPLGQSNFQSMKKEILGRMNRYLSKIPQTDVKELIRIHTDLIDIVKKEEV